MRDALLPPGGDAPDQSAAALISSSTTQCKSTSTDPRRRFLSMPTSEFARNPGALRVPPLKRDRRHCTISASFRPTPGSCTESKSRVSGAGSFHRGRGQADVRVPTRLAGRHRFPHHHDQRTPALLGCRGVGGIKPRRQCSDSRCRCSSRRSSDSRCTGACNLVPQRLISWLTVTEMLRREKSSTGSSRRVLWRGGLSESLAGRSRATIGNMAPEYGATIRISFRDRRRGRSAI